MSSRAGTAEVSLISDPPPHRPSAICLVCIEYYVFWVIGGTGNYNAVICDKLRMSQNGKPIYFEITNFPAHAWSKTVSAVCLVACKDLCI